MTNLGIPMKTVENLGVGLYFIATLSCIGYNAYNHNFQLLALWILITTQSMAIGSVIEKLHSDEYLYKRLLELRKLHTKKK